MVVLYGGFVCENMRKRNLRDLNPRALAVWYGALRRGLTSDYSCFTELVFEYSYSACARTGSRTGKCLFGGRGARRACREQLLAERAETQGKRPRHTTGQRQLTYGSAVPC